VLGVEKIGVCNFVDSIINYFVLFSMLGIAPYSIREIAKCRDDINRRNCVFSNLIVINLIGTVVALVALIGCTLWLPAFHPYKEFLGIGAMKLVFHMFLIEWFFQGLQKFKYITIRSVIIRSIYILLIFIFVDSKEDAIVYYSLTAITTIVNAFINWNYSRNYRKLSFDHINLRLFIMPVLAFGYYRVLTSMYTTFNVVFLGFTSGDVEVGFFSTATKLYTIIMSVFSAFTAVMVPKVSELLVQGNQVRLQEIANKTFSMLIVISLPIIIFSLFFANDIILILSGKGYEGAYTPFRIVIFLLLIIGMEQIAIQQFLMASNSNSSILKVSTTGAAVGITLNLLITPRLGAIGSAIAWGASETAVLIVGLYLLKKILGVTLEKSAFVNGFLWSFLYVLSFGIIWALHLSTWANVFVSILVAGLLFLLINLKWNKNEVVAETIYSFIHKFHKVNIRQ
jgi:O-antigen/teichoic acid export membrane protein